MGHDRVVLATAHGTAGTIRMVAIVAGSSAAIYGFLIVMMRLLSRRQLGQLTVVDLVVVLVLGSAVETAMIHGDTSLPAGLTAAATLLAMNRALTWIFLRSDRLSHLVNGGPLLLVHAGKPIEQHLRGVGMTEADLAESLRARGYADLDRVREVVLETDGSISALPSG